MSEEQGIKEAFDLILRRIIDDWYENVSSYYVTRERIEEEGLRSRREELKRFHDESGHRIKFAKDELDFTYGLRGRPDADDFIIEISVNNKVRGFDYEEFQSRLTQHYEKARRQKISSPYELRNCVYQDVFEFRPNLRRAFSVEKRPDRADIMRLAFWITSKHVPKLSSHPVAGKSLVEEFCVSPFRSVYATVYRRSR